MNRLQRMICKLVIKENGTTTILKRAASGQVLDKYGEPPNGIWVMDQFPVIISIIQDRRDTEDTPVGGLPNEKKEFLDFYVEGPFDIRTGDKIVYPANTPNEWLVIRIEPLNVKGRVILSEVRCSRDARY